ncbi:MAG: hypothetical protein WAN86_11535 [Hyphomicrobiaceae bacterium]
MLTRLLSTVVALAFLLFGATIAMEAMGLIFRPAPADPQLRIEAVVAKIEASLDPRNVPSEAEAEGLWPPPEEHARKPKQAAGVHSGEPPLSAVAVGRAWTVVVETEPEMSHRGPGG